MGLVVPSFSIGSCFYSADYEILIGRIYCDMDTIFGVVVERRLAVNPLKFVLQFGNSILYNKLFNNMFLQMCQSNLIFSNSPKNLYPVLRNNFRM